ncbi:MAG: branched-chain amino acid ABC transporter permease, partial [Actinobacteria bacterium]|nr:branched-chain amino acid ABC transporter permease [Actinomycetota bacterium]
MGDLVVGVSSGAAYALMAVGVVLIFKCTRALSIAQGEIGAFGFFVALRWNARGVPLFGWHLPAFMTLVVAVVIGAAIALVVERFVMRPLVQRPPLDGLIATLGVALFLALLELQVFGTATQFAISPVGNWRVVVFGATLVSSRVVALVVAAGVAGALYVFFKRSKFGLAVLATAGDPTVARVLGVPVNQVYRFAWV